MNGFQLPRIEFRTIIPGLPPIPWLVFEGMPMPPAPGPSIRDHQYTGFPQFEDNYTLKYLDYEDGIMRTKPYSFRLLYEIDAEVKYLTNDMEGVYKEKAISPDVEYNITQEDLDLTSKNVKEMGIYKLYYTIEQISPR